VSRIRFVNKIRDTCVTNHRVPAIVQGTSESCVTNMIRDTCVTNHRVRAIAQGTSKSCVTNNLAMNES